MDAETWHIGVSILDDLASLHPDPPDLRQSAAVRAVVRDELGDDRHRLGRVHREVASGAVEAAVTQPPGVQVAAVLVADAVVPKVWCVRGRFQPFTKPPLLGIGGVW